MKHIKPLLLVIAAFLTVLLAQSCYVSKPLSREVHISLDPNFPINMTNTGTSNFLAKHTEAEYRKYYTDAVISELGLNHVIADNVSPEFNVTINSLDLAESTKLDTVKDVKSKDNGLIRDLTMAALKTSGKVTKISTGTSGNWDADKSKDEKLNNNANVGQIILGQNKDGTVYTEKAFDDNEFLSLCAMMGRRAAVRIEKEISRQLN
jgi:hypothetical protein